MQLQGKAQDSFFWSELADLTHETQVAIFGWCGCEDGDGIYDDCKPSDCA